MKSLSDRLVHILHITNTKKSTLARAINVQPQTIQHLCQGNVQSSKFTFEIAMVLGVNTLWLATGQGEIFPKKDERQKIFEEYKIITKIELDEIKPYIELDSEHKILFKNQANNIFCTEIQDSSMEPIVPIKSHVFFRRDFIDKQTLKDNQLIIAYVQEYDSCIIRAIIHRDNNIYLMPFNMLLFKEILLTDNIVILGDVLSYQVYI